MQRKRVWSHFEQIPIKITNNKMKKILTLFFCICFSVCFAQKKVAVLEPIIEEGSEVSSLEKAMIRSELRKAIVRVNGYDALSRSDVDKVMNELGLQQSGLVNDNEIHRLGELCGADYLCISTLNKSKSQFYIEAYFIDVSTGKILNPASQFGRIEDGNLSDLYDICQGLIKELIGGQQTTDTRPIVEDFETNTWDWTIFSHDSKTVQVANGQLRITNYTRSGTTQSNVSLPIDISKDFKINFNFVIQKAEMFSSVGIKFAGNNSLTVNSGNCSYQVGKEKGTNKDAKMGIGQNRPVSIDLIKKQNNVTLLVNGIQVCDAACPFTTNLIGVFAGINTLAMLQDVTINYIY